MVYEFKFPDVGEGIHEGEIVKWHVKEGDYVKEHDVIAEIETDKAIVQIPSPVSGYVLKIHHKEGDTIKVGEVLLILGEKGETASIKPVAVSKPKERGATAVGEIPEAEERELVCKTCGARFFDTFSYNRHLSTHLEKIETGIQATPAVRRLSKELGIDLEKIRGTGIGGRITEDDVRNYAGETVQKLAEDIRVVRKYDMYGYVDRIPLKGVRKVTAQRMKESLQKNAPVTHMDEADVTELWKHRERHKTEAEKEGVHLTFMPFIIRALVAALKENPRFNATLDEEHEEIVIKKYYNIGIAVATEEGLLVPVIKIADQKNILDLAREIRDLADKATQRKLDLADLKGNTFTITNYGSIGGIWGTPIINLPDVAILGIGRIYDKPLVVNNEIKIRKVLPLSLTFDHRVNDGANSAAFVNSIKKYLEDTTLFQPSS